MRTKKDGLSQALWPETRRRILGLLLADPDEEWHLREIVRRTRLSPGTVQREAVSLAGAGILERRPVGRQVFYRANRSCPIFAELRGIVLKTVGLADVLRKALEGLGDRIRVAFVFGSMADGTAGSGSDADLLVIGDVGLRELAPRLQTAQLRLGRQVNAVTMTQREWRQRAASSDHFVSTVQREPKILLIGDQDELERLAGERLPEAT